MKRASIIIIMFVIAAGASGVAYWKSQGQAIIPIVLDPANREMVARGADIYKNECASCHGDNLEGQENWRSVDADGFRPAPPHDETGHTWHHSDEVLFNLTKVGLVEYTGLGDYKTTMPIFGETLSDTEIIAVLSYIKSRWSSILQKRHDRMNKQNS